ncbi:MAG: hypothetical protein HY744_12335 [Deltaproteobacteria bacterium]|nr:hypothetical protein [Deltaproteobacteria bacterium]
MSYHAPGPIKMPIIVPEDLRDHGDEARVARVWARLEPSLAAAGPHRGAGRRAAGWPVLCAAAAALVLGVGIGRWSAPRAEGSGGASLLAEPEPGPGAVFAAGTQEMSYALPGGGILTVAPGSIVDAVGSGGDGLVLRLVRGEVSLSTASAGGERRATRLALLVGQARVSTAAGSVRVRLDGDAALFRVTDGSAELSVPDAELGVRHGVLGANEQLTVPVALRASRLEPSPHSPDRPPPLAHRAAPPVPLVEQAGDWRGRCQAFDYAGAQQILKGQPGGLAGAAAAAGNAGDLMCIADAARARGGDAAAAMQALGRVVTEFPDSQLAFLAAQSLAQMHAKAGRADEELRYLRRYWDLSPTGDSAQDALCTLIAAEDRAGNANEVQRLAQQYRAQYPDGPCLEQIDRLLAEIAAKAPAPDGSAPAGPPTGQGDGGTEPGPEGQPAPPAPGGAPAR